MPEANFMKSARALNLLDLYTPTIRSQLLDDQAFLNEFGLTVKTKISFGGSSAPFDRKTLYEAVRLAFDDETKEFPISDLDDGQWTVGYQSSPSPLINLSRAVGATSTISHLVLLHPSADIRLASFTKEAARVNLPREAIDNWAAILAKSSLSNDEVGDLIEDLANTPRVVFDRILGDFRAERGTVETLVPNSPDYFARLVGASSNNEDFSHFLKHDLSRFICDLLSDQSLEHASDAMLLGAHSGVSKLVGEMLGSNFPAVDLVDWITEYGDPIAKVTVFEALISRASDNSRLSDSFAKLVVSMAPSADQDQGAEFKLLSACFTLVCGTMAQMRLLAEKPPFWRRLAALAQASLIVRAVIATGGDFDSFSTWAMDSGSATFLLQGLVDMRLEPRWPPDLVMPGQMRAEIIGRFINASAQVAVELEGTSVGAALVAGTTGLLESIITPRMYFPGPLEGASQPALPVTSEILSALESALDTNRITVADLKGIANTSLLLSWPEDLGGKIANALARSDYVLESTGEDDHLFGTLYGLCCAAAAFRQRALAEALIIVVRKLRVEEPGKLSIELAFRLYMMAAASEQDFVGWCDMVGRLLCDLAFREITKIEAAQLFQNVIGLCHLVPELWATCGQAEAALRGILEI